MQDDFFLDPRRKRLPSLEMYLMLPDSTQSAEEPTLGMVS